MKILTLIPKRRRLEYASVMQPENRILKSGSMAKYQDVSQDRETLIAMVREIGHGEKDPDLITIRAPFGGRIFRDPVLVDESVKQQLEQLIGQAPLPAAATRRLVEAAETVWPGKPIVLLFETAFFSDLPGREQLYALETGTQGSMGSRRFGFFGLFHEAAAGSVSGKQCGQKETATAIISICLEPRPEVAAVRGLRPVMVTSGFSPLEGLPGETTCGDLDPGMVLILAEKKKWGPEQINRILTEQSGIYGLTGAKASLADIFTKKDKAFILARQIMEYRLVQACGSAAASLGRVDGIVFSGRYAELGRILGPYLTGRLEACDPTGKNKIAWSCLEKPLTQITAERAMVFAMRKRIAA